MKCLQNSTTSEVRRVSEGRVADLIEKGWQFVPKLVWKNSNETSWRKNAEKPTPMNPNKKRRLEQKNSRPIS